MIRSATPSGEPGPPPRPSSRACAARAAAARAARALRVAEVAYPDPPARNLVLVGWTDPLPRRPDSRRAACLFARLIETFVVLEEEVRATADPDSPVG